MSTELNRNFGNFFLVLVFFRLWQYRLRFRLLEKTSVFGVGNRPSSSYYCFKLFRNSYFCHVTHYYALCYQALHYIVEQRLILRLPFDSPYRPHQSKVPRSRLCLLSGAIAYWFNQRNRNLEYCWQFWSTAGSALHDRTHQACYPSWVGELVPVSGNGSAPLNRVSLIELWHIINAHL